MFSFFENPSHLAGQRMRFKQLSLLTAASNLPAGDLTFLILCDFIQNKKWNLGDPLRNPMRAKIAPHITNRRQNVDQFLVLFVPPSVLKPTRSRKVARRTRGPILNLFGTFGAPPGISFKDFGKESCRELAKNFQKQITSHTFHSLRNDVSATNRKLPNWGRRCARRMLHRDILCK